VSSVTEAHAKGLAAICPYDTPDGTWLVTGGADGKVKVWDQVR
jgi:WD40 repeat protein